MYKFSRRSESRLKTCHPYLQQILRGAIEIVDFSILEGYRGRELQNKAFEEGRSQLMYPSSMHNARPSLAVDIAPYPIDWNDLERFALLAGVMHAVAYSLELEDHLRWGGDWDRDWKTADEKFRDYPHFELIGLEKKDAEY